jgi:hypothetical protein
MLAKFRAWLEEKPLPGILDVLLASLFITQARITETTLRRDKPYILIQPPLGTVRFMDSTVLRRSSTLVIEVRFASWLRLNDGRAAPSIARSAPRGRR